MPVKGADVVARNIIAFGGGFIKHTNEVMGKVRLLLDKKVGDNITLSDHSSKDLSDLDHPYAARWGTSKASALHSPYWLVHQQSGKLVQSKYSGVKPATIDGGTLQAGAFVGLDEGIAPEAAYVVYGTSKMIPRPVLQGSRDQIISQAKQIISTDLKGLVASFRGEPTK